jgi:RNA recognition motif-containing protein
MNIYVGSLSRDVKEDDLRTLFQEFGQVDTVTLIKDNFSGQPKGFGFIEMPNREEALKAIEGLNGKEVKGMAIVVNEARPRPAGHRTGGGGRSGGGGGGRSRY